MERTTRALFYALCAIVVCGTYCFVGTVFWPLYFPALKVHLWLGLGLLVATIPTLAWHIRKTNSNLLRALVLPGVVMIGAGLAIPGRPEYPAFGPIGWGAISSGVHVLLIAGCARLMPAPNRPPVRTSISGVALTAVLLWALHVGILGWQMHGDEKWGPMLAHSVLGIFCAVLVFPHLLWFRRFVRRIWGVPVVAVLLGALAWWWYVSYPHDLLVTDIRSPMDWKLEILPASTSLTDTTRTFGTTPANKNDRDLLAEFGPKLDPELIGNSFGCGDSGCHELLTKQWAGSAHRHSADNALYRKVVEELVRERGPDEAAFCASCHDPLRVLTGTLREAYADGAPPPGEGVGCVSCHGTVHVPVPPRNGLQTIREPRRYPGATREAHNANLMLDPRAHRQDLVANFRMAIPGVGCATCHRLELHPDMGAAVVEHVQATAQPPWTPEGTLSCTDCHMPTLTIRRSFEQAMYDHQLSGMNLDLALYATGDRDEEALALVRENTVRFLNGTIDTTGLTQEVRQYEIPRETTAVLKDGGAVLLTASGTREGSTLTLTTETTNHRAGHPFPSSAFDLTEVWQEVVVTDAAGAELIHLGALGDDLRLPDDVVRLGGTELGRDGKPIEHHRIWDVAAIVDKRQIPRGGSITDDYTLELPEGTTGPLTVRVAWNFRRANQDFTDWVFDSDGTTFPVHEMAATEILVP